MPCRRLREEGHNGFCAFHDPDGQYRAAQEARRLLKIAQRKAQRERQLREIESLVASFEERYKERKAARSSSRSRA